MRSFSEVGEKIVGDLNKHITAPVGPKRTRDFDEMAFLIEEALFHWYHRLLKFVRFCYKSCSG